jgi:hypothetical protein
MPVRVGQSVIIVSYCPDDDGVARVALVQSVAHDAIIVDGISFPAGPLPAWSVLDANSGGFVRHLLENDSVGAREKYDVGVL